MTRTTVPTSLRKTSAVAGVAALLALAGCSGAADAQDEPATDGGSSSTGTGDYKDGTYTADGSYQTPETVEKISVTLRVKDATVTDVEVKGEPIAPETKNFQGQFIDGIAAEVVGKKLDEIKVDKVAGSSLTSDGFNQALDTIKEQAAA